MAFLVKFSEKNENHAAREERFIVRASAEERADELKKAGYTDVKVEGTSNFSFTETNVISLLVKLAGCIVFIYSYILGVMNTESMALYWIGGFVIGILIIGFGEIIRLFDKIYKKLP